MNRQIWYLTEKQSVLMNRMKMAIGPLLSTTDATVTKLEIDHKLQLEEENVKWLEDRMKQSSELTTGNFRDFKKYFLTLQ